MFATLKNLYVTVRSFITGKIAEIAIYGHKLASACQEQANAGEDVTMTTRLTSVAGYVVMATLFLAWVIGAKYLGFIVGFVMGFLFGPILGTVLALAIIYFVIIDFMLNAFNDIGTLHNLTKAA